MKLVDSLRNIKPRKARRHYTLSNTLPVRILSYHQGKTNPKMKRALLSYLTQPIMDELNGQKTNKFSNDGLAITWPKVLSDLGYIVDIINWDDASFVSEESYDLVVSHGAINFGSIKKYLSGSTKYIYFSTGSYWRFHNKQEDSRLMYFFKRHHKHLPRDRYIDHPEEAANKSADAIICLGNNDVKDTYSKFPTVMNIDIGCFPDKYSPKSAAVLSKGNKDFLFFSGAGNVHKGLDLLIDVFSKLPDFNLHICTVLDSAFGSFYTEALKLPNIHFHGFVELRSKEFYQLTSECNYVIFPSCSEGSPGSVVECMAQGLVPIVSAESHIDVGRAGLVLQKSTLEEITQAIKTVSGLTAKELKMKSRYAHKITRTTHSPKKFEESLKRSVQRATQGSSK